MKNKTSPLLTLAGSSAGCLRTGSIAFCMLSAGQASAQDTWVGGGGDANWSTGLNWFDGSAPSGSTGILTFGGNTQNASNNDITGLTSGAINFTNDNTAGKTNGFTLGGNAITLGGNITTTTPTSVADVTITDVIDLNLILNADRTMTVNRSASKIHNLTVNGVISGNFTLTKAGNAFLTLTNAANSFTGLTIGGATTGALTVNGLANSGVNSAIGSGSLITFNGGALSYNGTVVAQTNRSISLIGGGGAIQNNATGGVSIEFSGTTTNDSTGNKTFALGGNTGTNNIFAGNLADNTGTLGFLKNGSSTWVLTGNNTYTGTTTIDAGTVSISKIADTGTATNLGTTGLIQIGFGNGGAALNFTGSGGSTARQVGIGKFNGVNGGGGATISNNGIDGGTGLKFTNATFNVQESSLNTSTRSLTLSGTNTDANEIGGTIQNAVNSVGTNTGLNKSGTGRWILGGANSYTGATSVTGGVLQLNNTSALGSANLTLSGGILGLGAGDFTRSLGTGTGQVQITAGVSGFAAYGADRAVNFGGSGTMVTWITGGFFTSGANTMALSHATATHTLDFQNAIDLNGFPRTFDVADGAAAVDAKLSGVVSGVSGVGPATVNKTGLGTLELSAVTHTYTGATNVNGGKLVVNGNISTSSLTTVASGATIGGTGTTGALTVASGGFITPGNSAGTLNSGNYTQAGLYTAEINGLTAGTQHDQINVTGTVNITGGSLSTLFTGSYTLNDILFILRNDGTDAVTGTFTGLAQGASVTSYGGFNWQISYQADTVGGTFLGGNDIALRAIPEPRAALLGGLGVLALLRRRRL